MFQLDLSTLLVRFQRFKTPLPGSGRVMLVFTLLSCFTVALPIPWSIAGELRESRNLSGEHASEASPLLLASATAGSEDNKEKQELLAVLDEETEIATKTRMNNDYVPGMVTVLHGDQLEDLGVRTVLEALSLVPGIQISRIASGEPTVKVRGISYPFNAGNIKVMLNSIALSRESSGVNSSVLLTPIAQVERIEVIRGPGSTIYGDFAMAGVVNIITRYSGGRVFVGGGDDLSVAGGGNYTYRDEGKDLSLGLNVSTVNDGESAAALGRHPDEEHCVGVAFLQYRKFLLIAEGISRNADLDNPPAHLPPGPLPPGPLPPGPLPPGPLPPGPVPPGPVPPGPFPPPPPLPSGPARVKQLERSWAVQGRQKLALGGANFDLSLGYLKNRGESGEPQWEFRGDRVEAGLDVYGSPWSGHQVLLGMSYAYSTIDHALESPLSGTRIVDGISRNNYSVGLQDVVNLGERVTLTLGLRYDYYNDVGGNLTPRAAAVYRPAEHHVLKAQYSEGFRSPSFWELYADGQANKDLDFEKIRTGELSYIYRHPQAVARLTLYHSWINNGVFSDDNVSFGNIAKIRSQGVEAEWEQQLAINFRWQANLSYVDTSDNRWNPQHVAGPSPGIAGWLGNLAAFWQPLPKLTVAGRLLYVGDRHATDGSVDGYELVDLTLSHTDLFCQGLSLRVGVKNIFNHSLVYSIQRPAGLTEGQFTGRTWWAQVAYDF